MMTALLQDDCWHFKSELSLKRSGCIHMYRKRTDFIYKERRDVERKKEEGNTSLSRKEKEHIIVTGQFQDLL